MKSPLTPETSAETLPCVHFVSELQEPSSCLFCNRSVAPQFQVLGDSCICSDDNSLKVLLNDIVCQQTVHQELVRLQSILVRQIVKAPRDGSPDTGYIQQSLHECQIQTRHMHRLITMTIAASNRDQVVLSQGSISTQCKDEQRGDETRRSRNMRMVRDC